MTRPLEPPAGYVLETPSMDDLEEVWRFVARWDMEVAGVADFVLDDMRQLTATPGFDSAEDWWSVRKDRAMVGLGMMWPSDPDRAYSAFGIVDVAHRGLGLGSFLIATVERRAGRRAAISPHGRVLVRNHADRKDPGGGQLLRAGGWEPVRSVYTMMGPLPTGRPAPQMPSGVTIRTGSQEDLPLIHELLEDTFAEHFGFAPTPYDEWLTTMQAREDLDPEMWFLAEIAGVAVGLSIATTDGARQGWIADLGVRKLHRGKGIAKALLHEAFTALEVRGCNKVGLGVDATNETGAVALYEQVGLVEVRAYDTYAKTFGAPDPSIS